MRPPSRFGTVAALALSIAGVAPVWAQSMRVGEVHFQDLSLAPGDFLTVSSSDGSRVWTYRGRGPHGSGDVRAFAVNGDEAIVRIHGGRQQGHSHTIDSVGHGTGGFQPTPEVFCGTDGREDVACHASDLGFDAAQKPLFTPQGSPVATWGELIATSKPIGVGDQIWLIQHPGGNQKKVGYWDDAAHTTRCSIAAIARTYRWAASRTQTAYACDSEGGSSGSPIDAAGTNHVIALHHYAGVDDNPCLNSATQMASVCADAGALLSCATN